MAVDRRRPSTDPQSRDRSKWKEYDVARSRLTTKVPYKVVARWSPPQAGSPQIVLSAQPSVDGPAPPDSWLSIGAGRRQTPNRETEASGKSTMWLDHA